MVDANQASASQLRDRGRGMQGSGRDFVRGTSVVKAATLVASATLGIALSAAELRADEPPRAAPAGSPSRGWTGAYVGGHLGYAWGDADWTAYGPGAAVTIGGLRLRPRLRRLQGHRQLLRRPAGRLQLPAAVGHRDRRRGRRDGAEYHLGHADHHLACRRPGELHRQGRDVRHAARASRLRARTIGSSTEPRATPGATTI